MITRTVTTQTELDAALTEGVELVLICSDPGVWLTVEYTGSSMVEAWDSATVEATGSATVRAFDSATVRAFDWATVAAADSSTVEAFDSALIDAAPGVEVHIHSRRASIHGGHVIDGTALEGARS